MRSVAVIATEVANTASVLSALRRAGAAPALTSDPAEVADAPYVVLPGVGAFGAGVARLRALQVAEPLRARVQAGRPTLAVCLGLQLLCQRSEESPGEEGLALLPLPVRRFGGAGVRVPQLGWNQIEPQPGCRLLQAGYGYFANSYCARDIPAGWAGALADHGGPFVAALERGPVLLCQFHPELSGAYGLALLQRWLEAGSC